MLRYTAPRRRIIAAAPLVLGALAGVAVVTATGAALAQQDAASARAPTLEVTHVPPLLTVEGAPVELRYDAFCVGDDDPELPCDARGTVFVRPATGARYERIALRRDDAPEGKFVATLPASVGRSPAGFAYYAVFTSDRVADPVSIPAGAAAAPQRSLPLVRSVSVDLGRHVFGQGRAADERVAAARWGGGESDVGLEQGRNVTPTGGSSFDVTADGTVHVLDEANGRLLRFRAGAREPSRVPVRVNGTIADLAVADDWTTYVLETTRAADGTGPLLRMLDAVGVERAATAVAERAAQVRLGPEGAPVVLQHPSGQWMAAAARGRLLGAGQQRATGRPGRPLRDGRDVVVLRHGGELRVALVDSKGVSSSWRVTSGTPLAEVQLAEPFGDRLVVVVRTYSEATSEFLVLLLGDRGLERRIALDAADWAETAPLSRFRLVGSSLYRLGSTPAGMFVDRIDLEVNR